MPLNDHNLATSLATRAGESCSLSGRDRIHGPPALRAAGDQDSQEFLAAELAEHRPHDAVMSEEAADDPRWLTAPWVWIIDPLDGTREFSEEGRDDWAIHVALWQGRLAAGAIAMPERDTVLSAAVPVQLPPGVDGLPRIAVSRTRPPASVGPVR
ncbi:inositol monophosphatase family protein [Streptomyces buecherae]|uniref:inositol monophosphatase family protein n=1 Tax=Streptomyces buecherae TaxID=2763006 RepID=UPI0036612778